jgi:hypothetical protein
MVGKQDDVWLRQGLPGTQTNKQQCSHPTVCIRSVVVHPLTKERTTDMEMIGLDRFKIWMMLPTSGRRSSRGIAAVNVRSIRTARKAAKADLWINGLMIFEILAWKCLRMGSRCTMAGESSGHTAGNPNDACAILSIIGQLSQPSVFRGLISSNKY